MDDPIDRLVVHLRDAANAAEAGDPQVAYSGGAGGQDDLLASPSDDGEGAGRESPRHEATITEVPEQSGSQQERVGQDSFELKISS